MTARQKKFCDEYLISGNATDAAIKAGYSPKTAKQTGSENLAKPDLKQYIEAELDKLHSAKIADAQEVLEYLTSVTQTITGTIDEVKAVEQAVFLILNVERYEWLIYSWNYGFEKKSLIGKPVDFCIPEIERRVKEALLQDDRITAVENFQFEVNKKKVLTTFTVVSIFGPIFTEMEVET